MSALQFPNGGQPPGVPVILPNVSWGFGRDPGGNAVLVLMLPGIPFQVQLPFDRIAFASFIKQARLTQGGDEIIVGDDAGD